LNSRRIWLWTLLAALLFVIALFIGCGTQKTPTAEATPPSHAVGGARPQRTFVLGATPPGGIVVSSAVPNELNPLGGGAPAASPAQAAAFAWNEFIALNWAAGPQTGQPGQRDTASPTCKFGDPSCTGPTVWETFRSKAETFPGVGNPPGYVNSAPASYGYDALPQYVYNLPLSPCDASQLGDAVPWVNLDETDEISTNSMYAGVVNGSSSPGNSSPKLIRFLAKSNRSQYVYVTSNSDPNNTANQWWAAIPATVAVATSNYLMANQSSPPAGSSTYVSNPNGTIETKAAWRPLNPSEIASGRFHMQPVRFYEGDSSNPCYRDATWGLVALHIIQKTASAPYFIYATFEQADNILTSSGQPVEDADGNIILNPAPGTATTPQVCLNDPQPPAGTGSGTSALGVVNLTADPSTCVPLATPVYCSSPGMSLYYQNEDTPQQPSGGPICVNRRDNAIPDYAVAANQQAHAAITASLQANGFSSSPWLTYKLVNVQYFPYDKVITTVTPNGSQYTSQPPYTAQNPAPSSYYQANIVVETNRSLQIFSGGLSPNIATDWNADGTQHHNTYYGGKFHDMGGCMGCHGSQGQIRTHSNGTPQPGDFSVILAKGRVKLPEIPAMPTSLGTLAVVPRNRTLTNLSIGNGKRSR
jgi:hypothetical protein